MLLFVIAYMGGVLTILSPCILPVLPFVFARADRSFVRSTLPLLAGMAITFAGVASLAAVGGNWAIAANQYGRYAAMAVLSLFAILLLWPAAADWVARPAVALGNRLSSARGERDSVASSLLLGVATGLLWTPCAGPILGIVLTGAALQGPNTGTSLLLFGYALGAATSLAIALFAGGKIFAAMKRSLGADAWIKRGLGVLVLAGVVAIFFGLDTGFLSQISASSTAAIEQSLLDRFQAGQPAAPIAPQQVAVEGEALPIEGHLPALDGAVMWLNTPPLTREALRGKVVLIDFWTYSCINCLRTLPYTRAWAAKYKDHGLVVLGVHTPEFAFERDPANVARAVKNLNVTYPVAVDSNYKIWQAIDNHYWPAHYFVDAKGQIRGHHFGEGNYDESEKTIQALLIEAGNSNVPSGLVSVNGSGVEAAPAMNEVRSPETYIGFLRADNFKSPGGFADNGDKTYALPGMFALNEWALGGDWAVQEENAKLVRGTGKIAFRFHARDLHLVLGPGEGGKPIRYRVTIDGKAPEADHGTDIAADGTGTVTEQRLYQVVRLSGPVTDHTFEIEFLDPGVEAYSFTFG